MSLAVNPDKATNFGKCTHALWGCCVLALLLLLSLMPPLGPAQQQQQTPSPATILQQKAAAQDTVFRNGRGDGADHEDPVMREHRMKALNAIRQKSMVEDTNKLLQLTMQLKDEVGDSHPRTLNPDQLRRVAEIEKLAKSIRQKMSDAIGPTPGMMRVPYAMGAEFP